jgi:DNA (cytosine-5)-methyltransferase 1
MTATPKLLDLFCGAGGAAKGYQRAGFYVVGVDIKPQSHYCGDEFVQCDALEYLVVHGHEYDAIHASPPCQAFTQMSAKYRGKGGVADSHPDLLTPTREELARYSCPWVIENVPGAKRHMRATAILHGGMFGLGVHRPRLFESNVLLMAPYGKRTRLPIGVYGHRPDGRTLWHYRNNGDMKGKKSVIRCARSIEEARRVMGIDWMGWDEIREAIPPAYTEWIGRQLMGAVLAARKAAA